VGVCITAIFSDIKYTEVVILKLLCSCSVNMEVDREEYV